MAAVPFATRLRAELTEERLLEPKEKKLLTCVICCEVMSTAERAPSMCASCQKPACASCWLRMLQKGECAFSRCPVASFLPCRALVSILDGASIACQHVALGCLWRGAAERQGAHLDAECFCVKLWDKELQCLLLHAELVVERASVRELRREAAERHEATEREGRAHGQTLRAVYHLGLAIAEHCAPSTTSASAPAPRPSHDAVGSPTEDGIASPRQQRPPGAYVARSDEEDEDKEEEEEEEEDCDHDDHEEEEDDHGGPLLPEDSPLRFLSDDENGELLEDHGELQEEDGAGRGGLRSRHGPRSLPGLGGRRGRRSRSGSLRSRSPHHRDHRDRRAFASE